MRNYDQLYSRRGKLRKCTVWLRANKQLVGFHTTVTSAAIASGAIAEWCTALLLARHNSRQVVYVQNVPACNSAACCVQNHASSDCGKSVLPNTLGEYLRRVCTARYCYGGLTWNGLAFTPSKERKPLGSRLV